LDAGCGSGLFSVAARKLEAKVHAFDCDPDSVKSALWMRDKCFPDDADFVVERGSVPDPTYLSTLGTFDIVYSLGVLHHTGDLKTALYNVHKLVLEDGKLWIAIYNDQGKKSLRWKRIKKLFNRLPGTLRFTIIVPASFRLLGPTTIKDAVRGRPFATWRNYFNNRSMSPWRDLIDWIGVYPFEVLKPQELFSFFHDLGFELDKMRTVGGG
jgi:SAM-dependent methyltransferase